MRTALFILLILGLIAAGLYYKNHGRFFPKKNIDEEISRSTRWDSILPGKWALQIVSLNSREKWDNNIDVEFFGDHQFRLNLTENYYNSDNYSHTDYLEAVVGGGATGKWYAGDDSSFSIKSRECSLKLSYLNHENYKNKPITSCESIGSGINFGTIAHLDFKSEIATLTKDTIMIIGKSYSQDYNTYCTFTRK